MIQSNDGRLTVKLIFYLQYLFKQNSFATARLVKSDLEIIGQTIKFNCVCYHCLLFDVHQSVKRKSLALEAFKFFGDYHGFVPFIGPILSREFIQVREIESGNTTFDKTYHFWSSGIIVGWDVRPTKVDWWGVRTNIRYFPFLQVDMPANHQIDFQQIEVNFAW